MRATLIRMICLTFVAVLPLAGCKDPAPKKAQTPVEVPFDPAKAQNLASKRIVSADVDAPPVPQGSDYIRISAQIDEPNQNAKTFLNGIASSKTQSAVVLGHIQNGPDLKLPAVPLYIFEKKENGWHKTFEAQGHLTPYFVAQRAPLDIQIEIVLLSQKLDELNEDAQKLVQTYATEFQLYSPEGAHAISARADAFIQRIALVEEAALKEVYNFNISYLENFAASLSLINPGGDIADHLSLSVEGRSSILPLTHNVPAPYDALLALQVSGVSPRDALGDLESGFWSVPSDALHPSCQAILGALQERLGLSQRDSARILWRMIQPHALFAEETDYNAQCTGPDLAALLNETGLSLPAQENPSATQNTAQAMNKSLSTIASLVKNLKDGSENKIVDMMADTLVVRDQARLLFSAQPDQLVESANDIVAPTLSSEDAAQYVMMMPIKAYGCYTRGSGQSGQHRATLLQLENDPNLWMLDFAFNDQQKINGIYLKRPSQYEFCRAIGGRTGSNRCAFSGKDFPGLNADRCG